MGISFATECDSSEDGCRIRARSTAASPSSHGGGVRAVKNERSWRSNRPVETGGHRIVEEFGFGRNGQMTV